MKPNLKPLEKELWKIEATIHRHGLWRRPQGRPAQVQLTGRVSKEAQKFADLLNRILYVRSLPFSARIYGPAKSSTAMAFAKECRSDREKLEFVRAQLNQLIADLQSLGVFKNPPLEKIAA